MEYCSSNYVWIAVGLWTIFQLVTSEPKVDYTGHQVLRVHPSTSDHRALLDSLEENPAYSIDFWSEPVANESIDLHIPPDVIDNFTQHITEAGMTYDVFIEDIQQLIDHEDDPFSEEEIGEFFAAPFGVTLDRPITKSKRTRRRRNTLWRTPNEDAFLDDDLDFFWYSPIGRYARYDDIMLWLRTIPNYQPSLATVLDIGHSFEGRTLRVIKIGTEGVDKPAIWIDAGTHAREWIAPATAVCLIHLLIALYGEDDAVTRLVNTYDWYILPLSNPDGYEYSHTMDRMWRKTRSFTYATYNTRCRGVDPNRNFGFHWQGHCDPSQSARCRSRRPCDDTYAGEFPFSEMETIGLANFILRRRERIKLFISLHSYAQLWLTPWSHSRQAPDDFQHMVRLANTSVEALHAVYNTSYRSGTPSLINYSAGGTSFDWAKGVAGIKYSYTVELRDTGMYGFLLPRRYIIPVCEETWAGIKTAALVLLDELF